MPDYDQDQDKAENLPPLQKGAIPAETINRFKMLLKTGLSVQQAAIACYISPALAARRLKRQIKDAETELRLEVFQALQQHIASNAPAAIFAAKAKLGWQDVTKIEQTTSVDYVDVPSNETKADWVKRQEKLRLVKAA
jgi:hypothetical protein